MKKRQVLSTYGRHRQRVVSVDLWSNDHVFSSSSDSFVSNDNSVNTSRLLGKENASDHSWLAEYNAGTGKSKPTQRGFKPKSFYTVTETSSLFEDDSKTATKKQKPKRGGKRQVLKDKSNQAEETGGEHGSLDNQKTQTAKKGVRKTKATNVGRGAKRKQTQEMELNGKINEALDTVNEEESSNGVKTVGKASDVEKPAGKKAAGKARCGSSKGSYDFSDIENFSLVISDSPPIEVPDIKENKKPVQGGPVTRLTDKNDTKHRQDTSDNGGNITTGSARQSKVIGKNNNSQSSKFPTRSNRNRLSRLVVSTPTDSSISRSTLQKSCADTSSGRSFHVSHAGLIGTPLVEHGSNCFKTSTPELNIDSTPLLVNNRRRKVKGQILRRKISTPKVDIEPETYVLNSAHDDHSVHDNNHSFDISSMSSIGGSPAVFLQSHARSYHDITPTKHTFKNIVAAQGKKTVGNCAEEQMVLNSVDRGNSRNHDDTTTPRKHASNNIFGTARGKSSTDKLTRCTLLMENMSVDEKEATDGKHSNSGIQGDHHGDHNTAGKFAISSECISSLSPVVLQSSLTLPRELSATRLSFFNHSLHNSKNREYSSINNCNNRSLEHSSKSIIQHETSKSITDRKRASAETDYDDRHSSYHSAATYSNSNSKTEHTAEDLFLSCSSATNVFPTNAGSDNKGLVVQTNNATYTVKETENSQNHTENSVNNDTDLSQDLFESLSFSGCHKAMNNNKSTVRENQHCYYVPLQQHRGEVSADEEFLTRCETLKRLLQRPVGAFDTQPSHTNYPGKGPKSVDSSIGEKMQRLTEEDEVEGDDVDLEGDYDGLELTPEPSDSDDLTDISEEEEGEEDDNVCSDDEEGMLYSVVTIDEDETRHDTASQSDTGDDTDDDTQDTDEDDDSLDGEEEESCSDEPKDESNQSVLQDDNSQSKYGDHSDNKRNKSKHLEDNSQSKQNDISDDDNSNSKLSERLRKNKSRRNPSDLIISECVTETSKKRVLRNNKVIVQTKESEGGVHKTDNSIVEQSSFPDSANASGDSNVESSGCNSNKNLPIVTKNSQRTRGKKCNSNSTQEASDESDESRRKNGVCKVTSVDNGLDSHSNQDFIDDLVSNTHALVINCVNCVKADCKQCRFNENTITISTVHNNGNNSHENSSNNSTESSKSSTHRRNDNYNESHSSNSSSLSASTISSVSSKSSGAGVKTESKKNQQFLTTGCTDDHVLKTPIRFNKSIAEELRESCHSLKALTPVKDGQSGRVLSPRKKLLVSCNQEQPKTFTQAIPVSMMRKCVKIGEGVYGEVFKTERNKQSVALKVIPIEGDFEVNDEKQKTFAEMLPEIIISKELSDLRSAEESMTEGFVQVKSVAVVKGEYPAHLLKQWDLYHRTKGSENDRPDMFCPDQLFIMFEFEECGKDLEGFQFDCISEAKSVLLQVTCSLAVAEDALQFEHRDLHWGNVLVKRTKEETLSFCLGGEEFEVETCGVKVAIIDFTMSRLSKDGCAVCCDLSDDETLFVGQGDYQFDIYRLMKEENGNEWRSYNPYTNVLWIHYLTDKLIKLKRYPNASSRQHKSISREFRNFLREALDYHSALHLLKDSPFFNE